MNLKKYISSFGLFALLLTSGAGLINAQTFQSPVIVTPYPSSAQNITRGLGSSLLTVRVVFPDTCPNYTATINFPGTVLYVPGSINKTSSTPGTLSITESNITNLRTPQFMIANVAKNSEITFTVARSVGCGLTLSGKDTVIVSGICGTAKEDGGNVNVYNIFAPSLTILPPPSLNNAIIGTTKTRTISVNNGGNGDVDTLFFYINYPSSGITNTASNVIMANGSAFSPFKTAGDTLYYKIFGNTLFGGDATITNGESVTITEPIKVLKCNTTTTYGSGWGLDFTKICDWNTRTSGITMAIGVPSLSSVTYTQIGYVNKCTPYDISLTATNGGTGNDTAGAMFNVVIKHAYVYPGATFTSYNGNILTYTNGRINGNVISTFTTAGDIVKMDLTNLFPTTGPDPDGVGVGLEDLDGDGFYDDLPRGKS